MGFVVYICAIGLTICLYLVIKEVKTLNVSHNIKEKIKSKITNKQSTRILRRSEQEEADIEAKRIIDKTYDWNNSTTTIC